MKIGSECLVCINGALLLGQIQGIYTYNVIVEVIDNDSTELQTVPKRNVIASISSNAYELIKEVAALNNRRDNNESRGSKEKN